MILNLIINAVQAMAGVSEGPRELLVTTGPAESDGVLVTVRDTGPGLPSSSAERLFDGRRDGPRTGAGVARRATTTVVGGDR